MKIKGFFGNMEYDQVLFLLKKAATHEIALEHSIVTLAAGTPRVPSAADIAGALR